ncbi:MAG: hypothetical protein ACXABY_27225 [Candidatus Thorarchaeota archaeon]
MGLQISDLQLVTGIALLLGSGIIYIILRIMYAPSPSKGMQSPNHTPSVDIGFVSLTRSLVDSTRPNPLCPECEAEIDFSEDLEWMGPTAFQCRTCEEVIELHRIENL